MNIQEAYDAREAAEIAYAAACVTRDAVRAAYSQFVVCDRAYATPLVRSAHDAAFDAADKAVTETSAAFGAATKVAHQACKDHF